MRVKGTRPGMTVEGIQMKEKQRRDTQKHRELCQLVGKWLHRPGRIDPPSCNYVAVEMVTANIENPDVIGFSSWTCIMIEVKVSRSDFLADAKKSFRIEATYGMGEYRYYCCPEGLITAEDLPKNWGLLYEVNGKIQIIQKAIRQVSNAVAERACMYSILRRENVKFGVLDYRKKS